MSWKRTIAARYGVALAVMLLAIAVRFPLRPWLGDDLPLATVFGSVAFAVWWGGWGPAALAAVVGYIVGYYALHDPSGSSVAPGFRQLFGAVAYGLSSGLIIVLGQALHNAKSRAEQRQRNLEWEIDDHRKTEAALRASESRLQSLAADLRRSDQFHTAIAELATDFAWTVRVEPGGRIVTDGVSNGFVKLLGYTLEELQSLGGWKVVLPREDREAIREGVRRVLSGERAQGDIRMTARDGRTLLAHFTMTPWRDELGRVVRIYGAAQDVTQQRIAEEQLQATRRQLQIVTDCMSAAVVRCSRDLRYLWVSKPYADWLERKTEDIVGRPIRDVVGDEAVDSVMPYIERTLAGETVQYEAQIDYRHLGKRWINAVCTPTLGPDGVPDGWVAVIVDIDERKRVEEAFKEAERRKDSFLAMLGHELRNPLAGIVSGIQFLKLQNGDPQAAEMQAVVERQAMQMTHIVDDLLDVSRIARGKLNLCKENLDLCAMLRETVEDYRTSQMPDDCVLRCELPDEPAWVHGDRTRLSQMVTNLIHNACKFAEGPNEVVVRLSIDAAAGEAALVVADRGIGLTAETLARIFEPFHQADDSLHRSRGGLGLGLALVRGVVDLHGGRIAAASEGQGQGTQFTVTLPLESKPLPGPAPRSEPAADRLLRILLIDDRRDAILPVQRMLERFGHNVMTAGDGPSGLARARQFLPEVVLCDIGMAGSMSGYDVARAIRTASDLNGIYLVAVTGYGQEEDRRTAKAAGFDFHLTKPVSLDQLQQVVNSRPRF